MRDQKGKGTNERERRSLNPERSCISLRIMSIIWDLSVMTSLFLICFSSHFPIHEMQRNAKNQGKDMEWIGKEKWWISCLKGNIISYFAKTCQKIEMIVPLKRFPFQILHIFSKLQLQKNKWDLKVQDLYSLSFPWLHFLFIFQSFRKCKPNEGKRSGIKERYTIHLRSLTLWSLFSVSFSLFVEVSEIFEDGLVIMSQA